MEDSFNARVGKIFGSLNSSTQASSSRSSLWSLSDHQVQREQWNRQVDEEEEEDEEEDEKHSVPKSKPHDFTDEEWELKSSIGLDSTLDFEEEEDDYDKVAVAPEERLYVKDVQDYDIDLDIPGSVTDPRARVRLQDDADCGLNPKSILKRKLDQDDHSKSTKRVRFDGVVDHDDRSQKLPANTSTGVPDYMLNPSRYTLYTFDPLSDLNEDESNKRAYMDFLKTLKPKEDSFDGSKPVEFIPRKKAGDTNAMVDSCTELVQQVGIGKDAIERKHSPAISVLVDDEESTVCAMEEDDRSEPQSHRSRSGRQYRTKLNSESED